VRVAVNDDAMAEPDETLTLTLSSPTGAVLADGTATGTVIDDD
jgi:chitinase